MKKRIRALILGCLALGFATTATSCVLIDDQPMVDRLDESKLPTIKLISVTNEKAWSVYVLDITENGASFVFGVPSSDNSFDSYVNFNGFRTKMYSQNTKKSELKYNDHNNLTSKITSMTITNLVQINDDGLLLSTILSENPTYTVTVDVSNVEYIGFDF